MLDLSASLQEKEVLLDLTRFMVGKVSDNELAQSVDDMCVLLGLSFFRL